MEITCKNFNPVNSYGRPPREGEIWNFEATACNVPYLERIHNGEGQSFYINSEITYGDFLIFIVCIIFFVIWLARHIWDFVVPISTKNLTKNDL